MECGEEFRRRGYGAACVSALTWYYLEMGKGVKYLCDEENIPSMRTAERVGYTLYSRVVPLVYYTPETDDDEEDEFDDEYDDDDDEFDEFDDDDDDRRSFGHHLIGFFKILLAIILILLVVVIALNFLHIGGSNKLVDSIHNKMGDSAAFNFLFPGYALRESMPGEALVTETLPEPTEMVVVEVTPTPIPEATAEIPDFDADAAGNTEADPIG